MQFRRIVIDAVYAIGRIEGVISVEQWSEGSARGFRILVGYAMPFRGHVINKPFGAAMFFFPCDMSEPQDKAIILRRLYMELSLAQRRIIDDIVR